MTAPLNALADDHGQTAPLKGYLLRSAIIAAFGGLLFGFDTAVISGATRPLTETFNLSPVLLGITVSSALPFVFFAVMMTIQFFVVRRFYPETARIRLEEIEHRV